MTITYSVVPIEALVLPRHLDGSGGCNRAPPGSCQLGSVNDVQAIRTWLDRYHEKQGTFNGYRREVERLLLWATLELGKPFSSLTYENWLVYEQFLCDPQPASRWVIASKKWPRGYPDWRPFAGPLSASSRALSTVVLKSLFSWLVNVGYLIENPLASIYTKRGRFVRAVRYLDDESPRLS